MDIKRFDATEFSVLEAAHGIGYYPLGEEAERAKMLMNEGVIVYRSPETWQKYGWDLTAFGEEYYKDFMDKVHKHHGHQWMTNIENNPDLYDEDEEYGKQIDRFAYSSGYHNGMVCKNCGFYFCVHCDNEMDIDKCTAVTPV